MFLDDALTLNASEWSGDDAVVGFDVRHTFASFNDRVDRIAAGLQSLGLVAGDRLSILADNHPDYLATHFACARTGVILHVLNVRLTAGEMAFAVNDAASQILFVDDPYTTDPC